jgi:aspartate aminotransferase-like enzyme
LDSNLRTPGPTPVPHDILKASAAQMINHRGPEFKALIESITSKIQDVFQTTNDLYILTSSGTGALESAVVNTVSPDDSVLCISVGVFGDRFSQIAHMYGAKVTDLKVEAGKAVDPEQIRKELNSDPAIKTVIVTHNETSTGITNDLESIAKVVKGEFNKLLLVDSVSGMGSIPCPVDSWDLDVVASGSQKGWMAPPGLAFISVSKEAWVAQSSATTPRFYFDWEKAEQYLQRGQNPWTPAISVMYAMEKSLSMILSEGLGAVYERHQTIATKTRESIKSIGLELFADEKYASNTVTAVKSPEGVNCAELLSNLRTKYNIVLAGGQAYLEGTMFRIGHLGFVHEKEIDEVIEALKKELNR